MKTKVWWGIASLMMIWGCGEKEISTPKDNVGEILGLSSSIESLCQTEEERSAMDFLYESMSIADAMNYSPVFFMEAVRSAIATRTEMPWGKKVSEKLFRHFVLPLRVNNESLDSCRALFYAELKPRVEGMSMSEAALEVNHWCHEKVTYRPSDGRTSSPLSTMRTAYGRCGEESVFTVNALRAVGIPARQVYTPRWAHTDDNHAWVEVWTDGKWHYLGACEPEPHLDMAWFSAPVRRGLLMHARVFGDYSGEEDLIQKSHGLTEINVTANYTPTSRVKVTVLDGEGEKVEGAKVEFKIYNYAEFYSAITAYTDVDGGCEATFGRGDILVWASRGSDYGYQKVSVGKEKRVRVVLDRTMRDCFTDRFDIVPPDSGKVKSRATEEEIVFNQKRFAEEDAIRNAYLLSFPIEEYTNKAVNYLAFVNKRSKLHLSDAVVGRERVERLMQASAGNYASVFNFIKGLKSTEIETGLSLLEAVSEKDLRDVSLDVFADHLNHYHGDLDSRSVRYILNPRISLEPIDAWRGAIRSAFPAEYVNNPDAVTAFVRGLRIIEGYNPQRLLVSPCSVLKFGAADRTSRDLFFVAMCRAFNIPARLEEMTGRVEYFADGVWKEPQFDAEKQVTAERQYGMLVMSYNEEAPIPDPKFDTHFTLGAMRDGTSETLQFRDKEGFEGTMSWSTTFRHPYPMEVGNYLLTTGVRQPDGKVYATISVFNVLYRKTTMIPLVMRNHELKGTIQERKSASAPPDYKEE